MTEQVLDLTIGERILETLTLGARNGIKIKYIEIPASKFEQLKSAFGEQLTMDGDQIVVNGPWSKCNIGVIK